MTINTTNENGKVNVALSGRLDSVTVPELEAKLNDILEEAKELRFDFSELEYISSAGLRILLKAQKAMNAKGGMTVSGVNEVIMGVFDITGFADILTIE